MSDTSMVIHTAAGVEVYENDIYAIADRYISELSEEDNIKGMNKGLFTGMLKEIYTTLFKYNKLDYNDIENIDNIFNCYTTLCYRLNKRPTILNFTLMVGISKQTIDRWLNSNTKGIIYYDSNGNRINNLLTHKIQHPDEQITQVASSSHSDTVKKWLSECESSLLDGAVENNGIGCIFALKANYGYRDNVVVNVQESAIGIPERSREEIAQNYGLALEEQDIPKPEF